VTYEEAQSIIDRFEDISFQTKGSGGNELVLCADFSCALADGARLPQLSFKIGDEVASLDMLELECFAVNVLAMAMKLKHQWRVRGVHV